MPALVLPIFGGRFVSAKFFLSSNLCHAWKIAARPLRKRGPRRFFVYRAWLTGRVRPPGRGDDRDGQGGDAAVGSDVVQMKDEQPTVAQTYLGQGRGQDIAHSPCGGKIQGGLA